MRHWVWTLASGLAVLAAAPQVRAQTIGQGSDSQWVVGSRVGLAWFAHSQSLALQHLFKPSLALHARTSITPNVEFGGGVSGILVASSNYQVAGVYGLARYVFWSTKAFQWGAYAGLGVGSNPPILHADLRSKAPLLPFGTMGTEVSWELADGFWLGIEGADEQLSVVHLGARLSLVL